MFDNNSRYSGLAVLQYNDTTTNQIISYISRRFSPQPQNMPVLTQTAVIADERLDQLTNRVLGNPLLFWLVADANNALDPWQLMANPGKILTVPQPQS